MSRRLKTLAQVAFHLNVTEETLREWNESGEGPQITFVRGQPMYHINDVEAFIKIIEREQAEGNNNYMSLSVG